MTDASQVIRVRPWWWHAHLLSGLGVAAPLLLCWLASPWRHWLALVALLGASLAYLQWAIPRREAIVDRAHVLLSALRLNLALSVILTLTSLSPAFAGLFAVLPLAAARMMFPGTRRVWILLSAAASLYLFATALPNTEVAVLFFMSMTAAAIALKTTGDTNHASVHAPSPKASPRPALALVSTPEALADAHEGAVVESMHTCVATLRAASRSRFAGIFWLHHEGKQLRAAVVETSRAQEIFDRPIPTDLVLPDVALADCPTLQFSLHAPPAWYLDPNVPDAQILVAPIRDDGVTLGVLIAERDLDHGDFHHADVAVADNMASMIAGHLRNERIMLHAARSRHDLHLAARASELLAEVLCESDVYRIAEDLFSELLPDTHIAIYTLDGEDALRQSFVSGAWALPATAQRVNAEASLIGTAIRRRHILPYRAGGEADDPQLFGLQGAQDDLHRHLVLPLISGREAYGALVVRVSQAGVFHATVRERLSLVTNQIAAALASARAYESMVVRATTDGMTQLLNHATFREQSLLAVERAKRTQRPMAVLMLDIDHFKSVNDTYGHGVGDDVIRAVAGAIRSQVRKVDVAARYGGEEFAILLEDTGEDGARLFAERLRSTVEALRHDVPQGAFQATISLGIAMFPDHGDSDDQLLENADAALYVSKRAGRNRTSVFSAPALTIHVA